jgi:hypothetical protein
MRMSLANAHVEKNFGRRGTSHLYNCKGYSASQRKGSILVRLDKFHQDNSQEGCEARYQPVISFAFEVDHGRVPLKLCTVDVCSELPNILTSWDRT